VELKKAVANVIPVFDLKACLACNGRVSQPYLYVAAESDAYTGFVVKTMIEDYLHREVEPNRYPRIDWRELKFGRGTTQVERDKLFQTGYSILELRPGFGPVLTWGEPGDTDTPVHLTDLMCMGTIFKTWVHEYQREIKPRFASVIIQYPSDISEVWMDLIRDLTRRVEGMARNCRITYGREPLFSEIEDGTLLMTWRSPGRSYRLRFDFSNFDIKIQVNRTLWHAFNNCFGPDVCRWLTTDFSEV
jgi:hypothetical protein